MTQTAEPLLRAEGLVKTYSVRRRSRQGSKFLRALDGVSLEVNRGEVVGVIGESGCGKSTLARTLVVLERPTEGHVFLGENELSALKGAALIRQRARIQMIFQDPYASLSPRLTVERIIGEGWRSHPDLVPESDRHDRAEQLMTSVGLDPGGLKRYPHQFSGGQRQRIGIARALALDPEVLICDEPTSGLDVSVQAQVINLLQSIQQGRSLTMLFISHDLSVIRHLSDRVVIMYLGKIVESGPTDEIFAEPHHPYTRALLSAAPRSIAAGEDSAATERIRLRGDVPSAIDPPSGCRFRTRCWKAQDLCAEVEPPLNGEDHPFACHFPENVP